MTKFILLMQVCSFLTGVCKPPIENAKLYNSWHECVVAAHIHSMNVLQQEGGEAINEFHINPGWQRKYIPWCMHL